MRRILLVSVLGLGLGLAACGESDEEKAKADVCDARDDIRTQVSELQNLTLGTATVDKVKSHLNAIGDDLKKITDAQGELNESDKQQVQEANQAFRSKLETLGADIGRSVSLEEAAQQLKSGFADLATTYEQALGPIDCG
jgi:DNA anti-recombination protein RmuC